jgi:hypothetical protein
MKILKRMIGLVTLIGILATTSLAAPMCALCAPPPSHQHVVQSAMPAHDHCGPKTAESPGPTDIRASHCDHSSAGCITSAERERPALQTTSSVVNRVAPAAQGVAVIPNESDSPPPPLRITSHSAATRLTNILRV